MSEYSRIWKPVTVKWRIIVVNFQDFIVFWVKLIRVFSIHLRGIPLCNISVAAARLYSVNRLVLRKSAALKSHRKTCIVKQNFSKAVSLRPKACYLLQKILFVILTLPFLCDNATVFTSCKQGCMKLEYYLVVSQHWF